MRNNNKENNLEVEIKLKINKKIYNRILSSKYILMSPVIVAQKEVIQKNTFFDTKAGLLRQNKWALRIREQEDGFYLTVKGPVKKGERGVFSRLELENKISEQEAIRFYNGFYPAKFNHKPCIKLYELFGNLYMESIFSFINYRSYINYKTWTLELDKTIIKNKIFYELELETTPKAIKQTKNELETWFKSKKWDYIPSKTGKMAKALKIYNEEGDILK